MPACSALLMGATNEVAETTVVAMPGEPAVTAALKADSMVGTVGWVDSAPVQAGVRQAEQRGGVLEAVLGRGEERVVRDVVDEGELPLGRGREVARGSLAADAVDVGAALLELDELHAAISAEAAAVALNRPAPSISRRREGPSFMFRVSIASSTTGSIFFLI